MPRDFVINGETLVMVKGGAHISGSISAATELGLCLDEVRVIPRFVHQDVRVDDFGPEIPVEVVSNLSEVRITMTLLHYDRKALDTVMAESAGGIIPGTDTGLLGGTLKGAGTLMGGGAPVLSSGCHFMQLGLESPQLNYPWRFLATYLADRPVEIPLGTSRSAVALNWRAIPYFGTEDLENAELTSEGITLWDHVQVT